MTTDKTNPINDLRLSLAYLGLILFTIGYYNRPEDYLGGPYLPLALIGGILGIGAYAIYLVSGGHIQRTRETMILLALLCWIILSIPFAYWKGGSFGIVKDNVSKILLLTVVTTNAVTTLGRLRKLLLIQVISVAAMGWFAHANFDETGRATGINTTAFGNSNDLAVILCINIPLILFFVLNGGSIAKKVFFAALMFLVFETILLTYSRTGFLAMTVAIVALIWHFGIRTGHYLRVIVVGTLLILLFIAFLPPGYVELVASIYDNDVDVSGTIRGDAAESTDARWQLMSRAVELTLRHPVFGVGVDGFAELSGRWQVEHNSYLQLSAEAGLPALFFFLLLISRTFVNLRNAERLSIRGSEIWRLVGAVRASLWAFLVGAFFTNFAYEFFPYFIFAFAAVTHQIALNQSECSPNEVVVVEPESV